MRCAILFPPQWDPRQPPLGPPTLAAFLRAQGHEARIWDLNIASYHLALDHLPADGAEAMALHRTLDPVTLADPAAFDRLSGVVQKAFHERYDPSGRHNLYWDAFQCDLSPNRGANWLAAARQPERFPFMRGLASDLTALTAWRPELVMISAISDTQILSALALAGFLRRQLPDTPFLAGGHAFAIRASRYERVPWLAELFTGICLGDGEPLLGAIAAGGLAAGGLPPLGDPAAPVPNLLRLTGNRPQPPAACQAWTFALHAPPEFDDLPLARYLTPHLVLPIETARGCPWSRCSFCSHPNRFTPEEVAWHPRPLSGLAAELQRHVVAGRRRFFFVDEALGAARLAQLSEIMNGLSSSVQAIGYARFDADHDIAGLRRAREAGFRKLWMGLETGSDRLLALHRKGTDARTIRRLLLETAEAGLAVHLFLIAGFPDETETDRQSTLDLLERVLPFVDPFGFSYDLFPLGCELETPLGRHPHAFGALAAREATGTSDPDLSFRLPLVTREDPLAAFPAFQEAVASIIERALGNAPGLRHLRLGQDSQHLLLLENRPDAR